MRIKPPRVKSHRGFKINDTLPAEAVDRLRRLELFQAVSHVLNPHMAQAIESVSKTKPRFFLRQ